MQLQPTAASRESLRPCGARSLVEARGDIIPRTSQRSIDGPLLFGMLLVTNVLMSAQKLTFSENTDGSAVGQLAFGTIYILAVLRLMMIGNVARQLLRHSLPLLAFLALNVVSTLWSANPVVTFKESIELIGTSAVGYYIVARFRLLDFLDLLALTSGVLAAASCILVIGSPARGRADWGSGPFTGVYSDKNALGAAMALAIVSVFPLLVQRTGTRRAWLAILFVLSAFLLVGSNSVTALLICFATCLSLFIALACSSRRHGSTVRVATIAGIVLVVIAVVSFGLDTDSLLSAIGRRSDLTGRLDFWPGLIDAIRDRPILGYGYNGFFRGADGPYMSYIATFIAQTGFVPSHAHDSCLQIALGTGIFGVLLFAGVLIVALRRSVTHITSATGAWPLMIVIFLLLGSYSETYFGQFNTPEWILFVAAFLYPLRRTIAMSAVSDADANERS